MDATGSPSLREANLDKLRGPPFDVLVLGGGINGAATAAALSARGARVALLERRDFGSATSQESSNLVWGGIKYLETYELGLVRKLCKARNELLRAFPSSVEEIRFYASHPREFRHGKRILILGTWLYWALGSFFTRPPRALSLRTMEREEPVLSLEGLDGGFEYSDAFLPDGDARFVWGLLRSALDHGCAAANYLEALGSHREGDYWMTRARDVVGGRELAIRSALLVNACGPFADAVNAANGISTAHRHVLSKGIHLLVDRITSHRRVLTFFADDGRLFFAIPAGSRTCIGTTDTSVDRPEVGVTPEDRRFVLDNINKRLRLARPLEEQDIVAERCGVRPLAVDANGADGRDWMQLSRRSVVETDAEARHVTIFGGKLTDCVNVGERLCAEARRLGVELPWPHRVWYGEPHATVRDDFLHQARLLGLDGLVGADLPERPSERLWRSYGAEALVMLEAVRQDPRGAAVLLEPTGTLRCEVESAARREMVVTLEDFLRRRTGIAQQVRREELRKLPGLREVSRILFGEAGPARVCEYFGDREDPDGLDPEHIRLAARTSS
ncbi:MAG TPA: FAD-dependent oxidoreductase [Anaeromyxobacter sp.]|nr:FAD-dependent oxidoreductase [Anaeromyxobacter sp.]